MKKYVLLLITIVLCLTVAACGSEEESAVNREQEQVQGQGPGQEVAQKQPENEQDSKQQLIDEAVNAPAEITIAYPFASEELYEGRYGEQIKQKFPHYTIHFLETSTNADNQLADILATRPVIDIIFNSYGSIYDNLFNLGLNADMSDLITKYQYDLQQFQPSLLDLINEMGGGEIFGLPWLTGGFVFLYNKDIFDQFGVDYPSDGMTWDEVHELARTMTRTADGVNYYGLTMQHEHLVGRNQLGAHFFDPETNEAAMTSDLFRKVVQNLARFYDIPGNELHPSITANNLFQVEQVAAMFIGTDGHIQITAKALTNWDIAEFPVFSDMPGVGFAPFPEFVNMTSLSGNRDAAFQVLTYIVSEEQQQWRASNLGFVPTLKDTDKIMENYGTTIPGLEDKNLKAIIPKQYANLQATPFYSIGLSEMGQLFREYVGGKDLNTALREASERANQKVQEKLAAQ